MTSEMRMAIQRTLILTLGEKGAAVAQHLEQMFAEWGAPPVVAVQHLDSNAPVAEEIEAALREISRLAHRATLGELGYGPDRLDELIVWVVGAPDGPLTQAATLANERALALLGIDPFILGLVPSARGTSADETSKQVCELSAGSPLSLLYLAGPVNEAGLTLDDDAALYEQAARFLVLHTCTPLRDTPVWVEQASGWGNGLGAASFGLTWLAWPGDVAQVRATRWLAEAVIRQAMGEVDGSLDGSAPECEALLREAELAPPLLAARLTPLAVTEIARLATGDVPPLAPWMLLRPADAALPTGDATLPAGDATLPAGDATLPAGDATSPADADHPLLASLEAMVREWDTVLGDHVPAWERTMETGIKNVIAQVRDWTTRALDAGGLSGTRALIKRLERRLSEWVTGAEQRMEEARQDLERIERDVQTIQATLDSMLAEMPRNHWREWLRLLRKPSRWVWLWIRWRKVQKLHARYVLLQAAALETRVTIEQMKRACGIYWAAGAELESVSRELDRLEHKVCDLFKSSDELPVWPQMPLLLGDDADDLLARLAEQHLPAPREQAREFLAQWGPLSRWWMEGAPHRKTVDQWLMEQTSPIATVPIWEVVRCRYADPQALQRWVDELAAQTSPLWRWDPTALAEDERARMGSATVFISPPDGDVPWNEDKAGVRVVLLDRADRLAVVSLRWGIPGVINNEQ